MSAGLLVGVHVLLIRVYGSVFTIPFSKDPVKWYPRLSKIDVLILTGCTVKGLEKCLLSFEIYLCGLFPSSKPSPGDAGYSGDSSRRIETAECTTHTYDEVESYQRCH